MTRTRKNYQVRSPIRPAPHETFKLAREAPEAAALSELLGAQGLARKPVAVLVAHGMGQQKPFDTLVQVANGLRKIDGQGAATADGSDPPGPFAARIPIGDSDQLARLELELRDGREVHIYEAYWAPLTEGQVALRDVIAFLLNAGFNGMWNRKHGAFERWVLGAVRSYTIPLWDTLQLLVALTVIGSLAAINAVIAAVSAAGFVQTSATAWPGPELLRTLSGASHLYLGSALAFGLLLVVAKGARGSFLAGLSNRLAKLSFWLFLLATFATACIFGLAIVAHAWGAPDALNALLAQVTGYAGPSWCKYITWPILIGLSALVRLLLVQYLGDVAAYVSPHKLDKFAALRRNVKDVVLDTARAIYALRTDDGAFSYDHVAIVGHSLGSVISYDCLNRLLNDDALAGPKGQSLDVLARTSLLLTFGSPLDKTAYVFGTRGTDEALEGRSALAATSQPLILDPAFRKIPWTNVHSKSDIISGALDLYDAPAGEDQAGAKRVLNVADEDATTWLMAHTEYWNGKKVWQLLHEALP